MARLEGVVRRGWLPALGVVTLAGIVIAVNPVSLARVLRGLSPRDLAFMLPTVAGVYVFRALAWWTTLRRLDAGVSARRAFRVLIAARPLVFLPLGELGRIPVLEAAGPVRIGAGRLIGTVAFQELIFLTLMGIAILPGLGRYPGLSPAVAVLLLLELGIVLVLFWESAYLRAVRLVERIGLLRRFDGELRDIRGAFLALFRGPTLLQTVALNAAAVALAFTLFMQSLHAVGASHVGFAPAAMVYALAFLLSSLSFIPGSLGAYEGIMTVFMALQGVPLAQGAAAALLYRGFNDVLVAAVGTALLLPLRRRLRARPLGGAREPAVPKREEIAVGQEVEDPAGAAEAV